MSKVTKLEIILKLDPEVETIENATSALPEYSATSFVHRGNGIWGGDFVISCPTAPELAEGDFVDDFAPYLRAFLDMKTHYSAEYILQLAVGVPGPMNFELDATSVALLSSIGASIRVVKN